MSAQNHPIVYVTAKAVGSVMIDSPGTNIFDGVQLQNGQLILLASQTAASENGVYVFNGAATALTRATAFDTSNELVGIVLVVTSGDTQSGTKWSNNANGSMVLGYYALSFTKRGLGLPAQPLSVTSLHYIPEDYGADATGLTDSTNAFNAMFEDMKALGSGSAFCTGRYWINSRLVIPYYCSLQGSYVAGMGRRYFEAINGDGRGNYTNAPSALIVSPLATIELQEGASLDGLLIMRYGMKDPTGFTPRQWIAETRAFAGIAVTLGNSGSYNNPNAAVSACVQNCTIIGFNRAILNDSNDNIRIFNVRFDCVNGLKATAAADISWYRDLFGQELTAGAGQPTEDWAISNVHNDSGGNVIITITLNSSTDVNAMAAGDLIHVTGVPTLADGRYRVAAVSGLDIALAPYTGSIPHNGGYVPMFFGTYFGGGIVKLPTAANPQPTTAYSISAIVADGYGRIRVTASGLPAIADNSFVRISGVDGTVVLSGASTAVNTVIADGTYLVASVIGTSFSLIRAIPEYTNDYHGGGAVYVPGSTSGNGVTALTSLQSVQNNGISRVQVTVGDSLTGISEGSVVQLSSVDSQSPSVGGLSGYYTVSTVNTANKTFVLDVPLGSVIDPPPYPGYTYQGSYSSSFNGRVYLSEAGVRQGIAYDFSDQHQDGVLANNLFAHGWDVSFKLGGTYSALTTGGPSLNFATFTDCASDAVLGWSDRTTVDILMENAVHNAVFNNFYCSSHGVQIKDARSNADNAIFNSCIFQIGAGQQPINMLLNSRNGAISFQGGAIIGKFDVPSQCGTISMVGVRDFGVSFPGYSYVPPQLRAEACVQNQGEPDGLLVRAQDARVLTGPAYGINGSTNLQPGLRYVVYQSTPITMTLPAISTVPSGWVIGVTDGAGSAATNAISFKPVAGEKLIGVLDGTVSILTRSFQAAKFFVSGDTWLVG